MIIEKLYLCEMLLRRINGSYGFSYIFKYTNIHTYLLIQILFNSKFSNSVFLKKLIISEIIYQLLVGMRSTKSEF